MARILTQARAIASKIYPTFLMFVWILAILGILAGLWLLTRNLLTFLVVLFVAAVVGVFPAIYVAYDRNRKDVQIERLEKEFDLLGLVNSNEKYKVVDLYNQVYSTAQFWLYIGLIMFLTLAVLLAFGTQLNPKLAKTLENFPNVPASLVMTPATSSVVTTAKTITATVSSPVTTSVSSPVTTSLSSPVTTSVLSLVTTSVSSPVTTSVSSPVTTPQTTSVSSIVTTTRIVTPAALSEAGAAAGSTAEEGAAETPPARTVLTLIIIGFLGAYVYSVQELLRRYNTFDLQPQTYASILVRMLVSIILVYVASSALMALSSAPPAPNASDLSAGYTAIWTPAIVAFIIGAFPSRGIQWFGHIADRVLGSASSFATSLPIENLDGISIWHAARLQQIGIDDAQNLAHADISKLLLTTQFDPQVIVNWIDQAMLYVKVESRLGNFHTEGIKTFTGLEDALSKTFGATRDSLAAALLGASATGAQLARLCSSRTFPNYGHIAEYYRRIPTVVEQWAAEGMRELFGRQLLQFESKRQVQEYIDREKSSLPPEAPAIRFHELGLAYQRLADWMTGEKEVAERSQALKDAESALKQAVDKDESLSEAWYALSSCLFELGNLEVDAVKQTERYNDAVRKATRAIRVRPGYDLAFVNRASAYFKLGNIDRSLVDLNEALRLNDRRDRAYYERAARYGIKGDRAAGNNDQAKEFYRKALADYTQAYFCGYADEAAVRLGIGDTARKLACLYDAAAPEALALRDDALTALTRATELSDGAALAQARWFRGKVYQDLGQDGTAREDLAVAVALDGTNRTLVTEYVSLLVRLGDLAAARDQILTLNKLNSAEN